MDPSVEYIFHAIQILVGLFAIGAILLRTGGLIESLKNLRIEFTAHVAEDKQAFKDLNNSVINIELSRRATNGRN